MSEQFFSGKVIIFCWVAVSEIAMVQVSRCEEKLPWLGAGSCYSSSLEILPSSAVRWSNLLKVTTFCKVMRSCIRQSNFPIWFWFIFAILLLVLDNILYLQVSLLWMKWDLGSFLSPISKGSYQDAVEVIQYCGIKEICIHLHPTFVNKIIRSSIHFFVKFKEMVD